MSFADFDYGSWRDTEESKDMKWYRRELSKANARPVVWSRDLGDIAFHCVHVSEKDPTQVSYTPSTIYGRADRQITLKPGRYISKFYPHLTPKQVQFYAQWHASGTRPVSDTFNKAELRFANTPEEIVHVYMNGPSSCMDKRHFEDADENPTRVYGAGDLAIAYLVLPEGKNGGDWIFARALCWPAKKVFGRVYPTNYNYRADGFSTQTECDEAATLLFNKMKEADYTSSGECGGAFNGAKILRVETDEGYVMPYLDQSYGVTDGDDHWIMTHDYEHSCQNTEGYICDQRSECDECGERYSARDEGGTGYTRYNGYARAGRDLCQCCYEANTFLCEGSGETFMDSVDSFEHNGLTYSVAWAERNGFYQSDYSGEWFDGNDDAQTAMEDGTACSQSEKDEAEPEADEADEFDRGTIHAVEQEELPL